MQTNDREPTDLEALQGHVISAMAPILIVSVGLLFIFLGWLWVLGTRLHSRLPASVSMNVTWFQTCVVYPALYITVLMFLIYNILQTAMADPELFRQGFNPGYIFMIFPFHILAICCLFYCFYFCAKVLKAVEVRHPVGMGDFLLEIVLFWFYPVGIWFIQPRLNIIFSGQAPPPIDPADHLLT